MGSLIYACLIQLYLSSINELTVANLLKDAGLQPLDLFGTISTFIDLDQKMPNQIRDFFIDLER